MTTRYTSNCFYAVSTFNSQRYVSLRISSAAHRGLQDSRFASQLSSRKPPPAVKISPIPLSSIEDSPTKDPLNPPASTLPPPLDIPDRGNDNVFYYWYRIGRAYGKFYWVGTKAVWANHKTAKEMKQRVFDGLEAKGVRQVKRWKAVRVDAVQHGLVDRAEFQLLERNAIDIGKLPFFGTLAIVFGEWLPLLVPFIPNAVPGTCRIPKQVKGMREKGQDRRRRSFRQGIEEPSFPREVASSNGLWPLARTERLQALLKSMRGDQLYHLSCVLNTHSTLWDRVQLPPPSAFLRHRVRQRLQYLVLDDLLLSRTDRLQRLKSEEATIACEERGLDVLDRDEMALRELLQWWVRRQSEDQGRGAALTEMLFRRPNAWQGR